jgi:hypothetical protein
MTTLSGRKHASTGVASDHADACASLLVTQDDAAVIARSKGLVTSVTQISTGGKGFPSESVESVNRRTQLRNARTFKAVPT